MLWKISKFNKNKSFSIKNQENAETVNKSQREDFENKEKLSVDNFEFIEKRLKDLELSREVESLENFKKISKLEKIVEKISKDKSPSPRKKNEKTWKFVNNEKTLKKRQRSLSSPMGSRNKSQIIQPKNQKLCFIIRDLEETAEKWKKKASFLEKKCLFQIKKMKKEITDLRTDMNTNKKEFDDYCINLVQSLKNNKIL